jgi:inosine-uridine nucleoside N-ribohydrolase
MPRLDELPLVLTLAAILVSAFAASARGADPPKPIPVILDTDIGDDIDDTWALALLLRSPELDLRLVVSDYGNARYRARIIAKFLERAGRTDVHVGIGLRPEDKAGKQSAWVKDYDLARYPGKVHEDGVKALIDTIMGSPEPVTLICIGPVPNIAEALRREPRIAQKARFVGMDGSVRKGYGGKATIDAEWNVRADVKAAQAALSAPWDVTITPLDTCGLVHLTGPKFAAVRDSKDPIAVAVMENYTVWSEASNRKELSQERSSTLYDPVAVYLSFAQEFLKMEKLGIRVDEKGMTLIDPAGKQMNVATDWRDMGAFEDLLVKRLTGAPPR